MFMSPMVNKGREMDYMYASDSAVSLKKKVSCDYCTWPYSLFSDMNTDTKSVKHLSKHIIIIYL